jgi:hypothetical protein
VNDLKYLWHMIDPFAKSEPAAKLDQSKSGELDCGTDCPFKAGSGPNPSDGTKPPASSDKDGDYKQTHKGEVLNGNGSPHALDGIKLAYRPDSENRLGSMPDENRDLALKAEPPPPPSGYLPYDGSALPKQGGPSDPPTEFEDNRPLTPPKPQIEMECKARTVDGDVEMLCRARTVNP